MLPRAQQQREVQLLVAEHSGCFQLFILHNPSPQQPVLASLDTPVSGQTFSELARATTDGTFFVPLPPCEEGSLGTVTHAQQMSLSPEEQGLPCSLVGEDQLCRDQAPGTKLRAGSSALGKQLGARHYFCCPLQLQAWDPTMATIST